MKRFREKLDAAVKRSGSLLCIGLDPNLELFPHHLSSRDPYQGILEFNRQIIEATQDLVSAYKPNLGFYVAYGLPGLQALAETRELIPAEVPVILDCKIGDFEATSSAYARGLFDRWDFDAITISPYMGEDGLAPLMAGPERGVFVLCKTSNAGSAEFQDVRITCPEGGERLFERVARQTRTWERQNPATVGLVVGATYPEHLRTVRALCPDQPILMPGIGVQSGEIAAALEAGLDKDGQGLIPSSSRAILYAGSDKDFASKARSVARSTVEALNAHR